MRSSRWLLSSQPRWDTVSRPLPGLAGFPVVAWVKLYDPLGEGLEDNEEGGGAVSTPEECDKGIMIWQDEYRTETLRENETVRRGNVQRLQAHLQHAGHPRTVVASRVSVRVQ